MGSYRSLQELSESFDAKRQALAEDIGVAKATARRAEELTGEVERLKIEIASLEKAAAALTTIGEERQREAQEQIELLVTQGLQKIFGPQLSFKVVQSVKGRTPIVEFLIVTTMPDGSARETDILNAMGGGVSAITGFLLRLVVLLLDKSSTRRILVLDETFAHVSDTYLPALAEFLREIVDKANMQIIMVTHQEHFTSVADKAYRFQLGNDGYTVAKEM